MVRLPRSLRWCEVIRNSLALATAGCAILLLLQSIGWVDLRRIAEVIMMDPKSLLGIVLAQLGILVANPLRYYATLRAFNLRLPFQNVLTACTMSACIAPWLPGSAAVGEAIRTGLLLARGTGTAPPVAILAATGLDNGIRLFVELNIGFGAGVLLLLSGMGQRSAELGSLVVLLGVCCLALGAVPLVIRHRHERWLPGRLTRMQRWVVAVRDGIPSPQVLLPSLLLGAMPTLLNGLGFFFAAKALQTRIDWVCILVASPLLLISSLFPLGIAGIGGNQVITVAAFTLLGIPAQDATSAELLHTAVVLALNGVILLPFLPRLPRILHARNPHISCG